MSAGAVNIRLGAIVTDFLAGFQSAGAAVSKLSNQLNSNLSASFAASDRQSKVFDRGIGRLGESLQSFGRQATIATAGIALIGATAFKTYADINSLQLGLENITGSAAGAKARFAELMPIVRLPGLGLEEAVKGDVRLQAIGISAQKSKEILMQFGNALALTGGGKFELDNVLTQLTQMSSKSKVLSEDLKPILTSSPAVAKAIKQLFGTVDSEQISSKLQAAGRGPQDFINDLVAKLSQLERVKGGPKNAIENLGDSIKLAEFNFGQAADKAFGLTELIDKLGTSATGLADKFAQLSPSTQKMILVAGGLALAIGPIALGIGGLLALVPSVLAGAAAITTALGVAIGPLLLIGAGIVATVAIVAANWDSIKTILTDSGIWESVKGLVGSTFDFIGAIFSDTVAVLGFLWDRFGGFIVGAIKTAFEAVAGVFRFGAGVLQGIFSTLAGLLTGDWSKLGNGLLTIAKSIWNLIIDVFKLSSGTVIRIISGTLQFFGATSIAEKLNQGLEKAYAGFDKLKGNIQSTQAIAKAGIALPITGAKTTSKPFDYSSISLDGSALDKAKDRLKELKNLIGSGNLQGKDVSALQAEFDTLSKRVKDATASTSAHKKAHEDAKSTLTTNERILKQLSLQYRELGDAAPASLIRQVEQFEKLVAWEKQSLKGAIDLGNALKNISAPSQSQTNVNALVSSGGITTAGLNGTSATVGLPGLTDFQTRTQQQLQDSKLQIEENKKQLQFSISSIPTVLGSVRDEMQRVAATDPFGFYGVADKVLVSAQAISSAISSAKENLISGGADLIASFGEGLASGKASFKNLIVGIINLIADSVISIGKALIATGIPLALFPATSPLGIKQILTGGAIVLAGGVAKGLASAIPFADGGLVSGPTLGLVGEYAGARNNPEVIAPLDKLKGMIGGGGNRVEVFGRFELEGTTAVALVENTYQADSRYR